MANKKVRGRGRPSRLGKVLKKINVIKKQKHKSKKDKVLKGSSVRSRGRPKKSFKIEKIKKGQKPSIKLLIQGIPEKPANLTKETFEVKNFIGGMWKQSPSGQTFNSLNPSNHIDTVAIITRSNFEDVKEAITFAKSSFEEWKNTPAENRAKILFRTAQILEEQKEFLSNLVVREVGFTKHESDEEVRKAISHAYHLASEGTRLDSVYIEANNNDNYLKREPLGVFAIITPWCSPLEVPVNKIFSALVAGNTVVFKPARASSTCAMFIVKALEKAGIFKGVINLILGSGSELGSYLISHSDVDGVSFTGSTNVGKLIGGSCGTRFKKHELNLGDKSAMIVLNDADINNAVNSALVGAFRYAGQRCNSTSRIIVLDKVYDQFVDKFVNTAKKLTIAPGYQITSEVCSLIDEVAFSRINEAVRIGRNEDRANMKFGGGRYFAGDCRSGFFYEPTIFTEVTPEMNISQQEILGPMVCIMRARNENDAVRIANSSSYGLVASIFSSNVSKAHKIADQLDVGIVNINLPTTHSEPEAPFVGRKDSGSGHIRGGSHSLDPFTELKVVSVSKGN